MAAITSPIRRSRNFIPAGEETPEELERSARKSDAARAARQGFRPNFIPGPDTEPVVFLGAEAEHELADQSRKRMRAASRERRWQEAVAQVMRMGAQEAVAFIGALPRALMELHLLAEEKTQNRPEVLRHLPAVGDKARANWAFAEDLNVDDIIAEAKSDGQEDVPVAAIAESAADAPERAVVETSAPEPEAKPKAPKKSRAKKAAAEETPDEDPAVTDAFAAVLEASEPVGETPEEGEPEE